MWVCAAVSHHLAALLGGARLPEGEDVPADRDLPPDALLGVLGEALPRVHHQHPVGGEAVHLSVQPPPLGRLLLQGQTKLTTTS